MNRKTRSEHANRKVLIEPMLRISMRPAKMVKIGDQYLEDISIEELRFFSKKGTRHDSRRVLEYFVYSEC